MYLNMIDCRMCAHIFSLLNKTIIGSEKNSKSPPTPFNWWRCSMWRLASLWRNVCLRGKVFPKTMMIYKIHCIGTWRDPMHVLFCAQPEHKSVIWMLEDETLKFEALYAKFDKILFEIWKFGWNLKTTLVCEIEL